jgi:hypothetical protein
LVKKKHLFTGDVHEKITRRRKYWNTKNFMIHYTYKGLTNLLQKKILMLGFKTSLIRGKATHFHLIFKPFYRFFFLYFKEVLWMGFQVWLASVNVMAFSRYAKIILIEKV